MTICTRRSAARHRCARNRLCLPLLTVDRQSNAKEAVELLLAHNADVHVKLSKSESLLIFCARVRRDFFVILLSLFSGSGFITSATQAGFAPIASIFLRAGADASFCSPVFGTAREVACKWNQDAVVQAIDDHLRSQLRAQLVDLCCALTAADWPVLVQLECFAWRAATTYAGQHVTLPLDLQWRISKHIREAIF